MMPLNFVKVSSLLLGCIILFLYYRRAAESTEPLASSSLIFGNEHLSLDADLCETIAPNPVKSATKFAFAPQSPTLPPPPPPPSLTTDSQPLKPPPTPPFTDYPLPWLSFAQERQCTLDPYFYQQIDIDLAPFRRLRNETFQKPISKQMIEETSRLISITRQTHLIITFHQDGNVEFNREEDMFLSHTFGFCRGVASYLPEGLKIIINQDDSPFILRTNNKNDKSMNSSFRGNHHQKKKFMNGPETAPPTRSLLPFFSYCKTKEYNDILIPSFQQYFWGCVVPKDQLIPFESLEKNNNTIFWRGCTTGTEIRQDNYYKQSNRFLAVEWGMNVSKEKEKNNNNNTRYPYETDIAFHEICHCKDEQTCEEVKKDYKFGNIVECSEHQRYRYLLIVDGNTWVQRFMQFLHFESLLFYHPHFIEWYSTFIRPDEHYIWIQDDYSDLDEKLRWAMENPGEVSEMVKRTSLFAQRHLRLVDLECYWFLLLLRYAELVEQ